MCQDQKKTVNNHAARVVSIFEEYGDFLQKTVSFDVKDEHLARDILQDFFVKLMSRTLPDDIRDMKSYLFRAIHNDIKNAYRRLNRYKDHIDGYKEYRTIINERSRNAESHSAETQDIEKLLEMIHQKLPERERQAIVLKYINGYNTDKISEEMGIKPRSIARYISVGLKRLRDYLAARGDIE